MVTVEPVRSEDEPITFGEFVAYGFAFVAGLGLAVGAVTAVVLTHRRRRPRAATARPGPPQVLTPPPGSTSTQAPATPPPDVPGPESIVFDPPPAPAATNAQPLFFEHDEATVIEPDEVIAGPPEWEYCEIDWWRGYVKSNFVARATTPGDADYVVRESPMFRWRGNGIPDATPESTAAHERLIEKLLAEGWEEDGATSPAWFARSFRRRAPEALPR